MIRTKTNAFNSKSGRFDRFCVSSVKCGQTFTKIFLFFFNHHEEHLCSVLVLNDSIREKNVILHRNILGVISAHFNEL